MKLSGELKAFCDRLGHTFENPELIVRAVTHASIGSAVRQDNQRLEFLGDRILGLIIAEALLEQDPTAAEGVLAPRYNALVRKETCADVAETIDLGAALKMGRSEMLSGGRRKQAILGDAMEAVIAAVYKDAGFDGARDVILRLWAKKIETAEDDARDPKTTLQEWSQARGMPPPDYVVVDRSGPDHAPIFVIKVQLKNGASAQAQASSKRQAQQDAAKALLAELPND